MKIQKHNGRLKTETVGPFHLSTPDFECFVLYGKYGFIDILILIVKSFCQFVEFYSISYISYQRVLQPNVRHCVLCFLHHFLSENPHFESKGAPWTYCSSGMALTWTVTGLV